MTEGFVSEIFCSRQGEGPFVGQRQVFFRTAGCSATCRWCDTAYSKVRSPRCVVHGPNGEGARVLTNPISATAAVEEVLAAARRAPGVTAVSITGGEPLEQGEFVLDVAARCKGAGLGVYLETNGLHDAEFAAVIPYVDVVAMDIKLPSATGVVAWKRHEAFLARVFADAEPGRRDRHGNGGGVEVFVKVVVDDRSTEREIETAARLVASADPGIPFVLQPESRAMMSKRTTPESLRQLRASLASGSEAAAAHLEDVRIIPQVHKILGIR
jgi:7-carboxy-7-deazaguanine synthase